MDVILFTIMYIALILMAFIGWLCDSNDPEHPKMSVTDNSSHELVVAMADGREKRALVAPALHDVKAVYLTGYMFNGGIPGTPLTVRISNIESHDGAYVANVTDTECHRGSAAVVMSEAGKWHNITPQLVGKHAQPKAMHHFDVSVHSGTGAFVSAITVTDAVALVVLKFHVVTGRHSHPLHHNVAGINTWNAFE